MHFLFSQLNVMQLSSDAVSYNDEVLHCMHRMRQYLGALHHHGLTHQHLSCQGHGIYNVLLQVKHVCQCLLLFLFTMVCNLGHLCCHRLALQPVL